MPQFRIDPMDRFAGGISNLKRPQAFACFSFDSEHRLQPGSDRSLRFYYTPPVPADLSKGFDTFRKLDDTRDDHLDPLLLTLMQKEKADGLKVQADFITWRGMTTKLLTAPYADFDGFEMNATCFQGTIFIEESHDYKLSSRSEDMTRQSRAGMAPQELMTYWGYKFETLCLLPDTWGNTTRDYIESRQDMKVSNHEQYCSIVQTGIGDSKIVLGGEVDAIWDQKPTLPTLGELYSPSPPRPPINWVELKTSLLPPNPPHSNPKHLISFERKLLKFWAQSYLLGVGRVLVGYRDKDGILRDLQEFKTLDIPSLVRGRAGATTAPLWDNKTCVGFVGAFLEFLKEHIKDDSGVWKIRRKERSREIEVFKVEESGTGDILAKEFVEWRMNGGASIGQNGGQGLGGTKLT